MIHRNGFLWVYKNDDAIMNWTVCAWNDNNTIALCMGKVHESVSLEYGFTAGPSNPATAKASPMQKVTCQSSSITVLTKYSNSRTVR